MPGMSGRAFAVREVLDEAVRALSLSNRALTERVLVAAVVIADGLCSEDFTEAEDRELLRGILAVRDSRASAMSEAAAGGVAAAILDLRDTVVGRALGDALARTRSDAPRRARRRTRRA
jgi:hypothetical protein